MNIIKELNISNWTVAWAFLTGGWSGIATVLCEAFSRLLQKANADKLKEYSDLAAKIASYIRTGIDLFVKDEAVKDAASATAQAIETLASHIADGKYDEKELDADIDNVEACIAKWKAVAK